MSIEPKPVVEVFYSYSHRDETLRDELERHLSILKHQGVITAWHDRKIGAGMEWVGQIDTHLNTAHVILLLISSDFLASKYCYDVEMRRAMERHEAGEARVIPIILRPVSWRGAPFENLQALPKDAKPVTSWGNQDEAFVSIAEGIRSVVEELLKALRSCEDISRTTVGMPANFQSTSPEQERGGDVRAVADEMVVICFTDLRGSSNFTEELGRNALKPHLDEHFSFGRTLTARAGGRYVQDLHNGILATFPSIENAISFALQLQELYMDQPCRKKSPLELRIGLFLGPTEITTSNIFESAVNRTDRVQGKAETHQILMNKRLFESFNVQWGMQKTRQYFIPAREYELKGVSNSLTQELFSFEWQQFRNDCPDYSLAKLVFQHLHEGKVVAPYLGIKDLLNSGVIVWPVVPRDIVNAIHRAQAEVIRLLVLLGWRVHLLIADCGSSNNYEKSDAIRFSEKLKKYIANRGIEQIKMSYLSDFFTPVSQKYDRIQEIFRNIISDLTLQDFLNIVNKGYTDRVKDDILRRATLDCLRPVLSLAVVLYLAQEAMQKSIIVAGADERRQWERAYDIPNTRDRIGVLMIPVLGEDDENHQRPLSKAGPIWSSPYSLSMDMSVSNTAWWAFHLHAFIPAFPATFVEISGTTIYPREWNDPKKIPEKIRKEDLIQKVWTLLDPAS